MSITSNQGESRDIQRQNTVVGRVFLVGGGLPGIAHVTSAHYELQTFARAQTIF